MSFVKLKKYLGRIIPDQTPGIVCWVGTKTNTLFFEAFGYAQIKPYAVRINKKTVFDLASLTKPLATATAVMKGVDQGLLTLQDRAAQHLDEFQSPASRHITIARLLTHTAGLPGWFPLYILPRRTRIRFIAQAAKNERRVVYSCLGYIILGTIIAKVVGRDLNAYCRRHIFEPLGLSSMGFKPRITRNIAATENGNMYERTMAAQFCDPSIQTWRKQVIRGEVHDGNCYYGYHGIAGNAGLFGNAEDCSRFLQAYSAGSILPVQHVRNMTRDHTGGPEKRGLGWWMDPYPGILSDRTWCHTGFTGTMVCVDPKNDIMIVLLTNAIHPRVRQEIKKKIRRKVVELVAEELNASTLKAKR